MQREEERFEQQAAHKEQERQQARTYAHKLTDKETNANLHCIEKYVSHIHTHTHTLTHTHTPHMYAHT
jgi:hypothetical protein